MPEPQVVHKLIQPLPTKEEKHRELILTDLVLCRSSWPFLFSFNDGVNTNINEVTCTTCWEFWTAGIYR